MNTQLHAMALSLAFLLLTTTLKAQNKTTTLAPEFTIHVPTGALAIGSSLGIGPHLQAAFPLKKSNFSILARSGVDLFFGKTFSTGVGYILRSRTSVTIPVLVGARYAADHAQLDLEMGVLAGTQTGSSVIFQFCPALGYRFDMGNGSLDPFVRLSTSFGQGTFFSFGARYQFEVGR